MQQAAHTAAEINVVLIYSPSARVVHEFALTLPVGATLAQAISLWQNQDPLNDAALAALSNQWGIWGKAAKPGAVLKAHDRIELYRALTVDPKTARRQRFKRQGSKGAGLFAQRRTGGKAGY